MFNLNTKQMSKVVLQNREEVTVMRAQPSSCKNDYNGIIQVSRIFVLVKPSYLRVRYTLYLKFFVYGKQNRKSYLNVPAPSLKDGAITTDQETEKKLILKESKRQGTN
jgi:hypothetical protein